MESLPETTILCGTSNGVFRFHDVQTGKCSLAACIADSYLREVVQIGDEEIASTGPDRSLHVYNLASSAPSPVSWDGYEDGRVWFVSAGDPTLRLYPSPEAKKPYSGGLNLKNVVHLPRHNLVATTEEWSPNRVLLWDVSRAASDGALRTTLDGGDYSFKALAHPASSNPDMLVWVAGSRVRMCNLRRETVLRTWKYGHMPGWLCAESLTLSDEHGMFFIGILGDDRTVKACDLRTLRVTGNVGGLFASTVYFLFFREGAHQVVARCGDYTTHVFDVRKPDRPVVKPWNPNPDTPEGTCQFSYGCDCPEIGGFVTADLKLMGWRADGRKLWEYESKKSVPFVPTIFKGGHSFRVLGVENIDEVRDRAFSDAGHFRAVIDDLVAKQKKVSKLEADLEALKRNHEAEKRKWEEKLQAVRDQHVVPPSVDDAPSLKCFSRWKKFLPIVRGKRLQVPYSYFADPGVRDAYHPDVLSVMREYEAVAPVDFVEKPRNCLEAYLRIGLGHHPKFGGFAYMGSCFVYYDPTMYRTTMHLDSKTKGVARHELAHALGRCHEHPHPGCTIMNRTASIAELLQWCQESPLFQSWTEADIKRWVLKTYPRSHFGHDFDRQSIMMYSIPAKLSTTGRYEASSRVLSPIDLQEIKRWLRTVVDIALTRPVLRGRQRFEKIFLQWETQVAAQLEVDFEVAIEGPDRCVTAEHVLAVIQRNSPMGITGDKSLCSILGCSEAAVPRIRGHLASLKERALVWSSGSTADAVWGAAPSSHARLCVVSTASGLVVLSWDDGSVIGHSPHGANASAIIQISPYQFVAASKIKPEIVCLSTVSPFRRISIARTPQQFKGKGIASLCMIGNGIVAAGAFNEITPTVCLFDLASGSARVIDVRGIVEEGEEEEEGEAISSRSSSRVSITCLFMAKIVGISDEKCLCALATDGVLRLWETASFDMVSAVKLGESNDQISAALFQDLGVLAVIRDKRECAVVALRSAFPDTRTLKATSSILSMTKCGPSSVCIVLESGFLQMWDVATGTSSFHDVQLSSPVSLMGVEDASQQWWLLAADSLGLSTEISKNKASATAEGSRWKPRLEETVALACFITRTPLHRAVGEGLNLEFFCSECKISTTAVVGYRDVSVDEEHSSCALCGKTLQRQVLCGMLFVRCRVKYKGRLSGSPREGSAVSRGSGPLAEFSRLQEWTFLTLHVSPLL